MTRSDCLYRGVGCILSVLSAIPLSASAGIEPVAALSRTAATGSTSIPTRSQIAAPSIVTAGTPGLRAVLPLMCGVNYDWSRSSGVTSISGDGTNAITFTAGREGCAVLRCTITSGKNITRVAKLIAVVAAPKASITVKTPVTAGPAPLQASVPFQLGCTYAWKLAGARLLTGSRSHTVAFEATTAGVATLTCTVTNLAGTRVVETRTIQVLAAPAPPVIVAPTSVSLGTTCTASVPVQDGCSYAWSVLSGPAEITGGAGTPAITFVASGAEPLTLQCTVMNAAGSQATGTVSVAVSEAQACTGTMLQTYLSFNAEAGNLTPTPVPVSLDSTAFRVVQADGKNLPGTYDSTSGKFEVPGVPAEHFWLISNNYNYIWTNHRTVDFGWDQPNRADIDYSFTTAVFNLTGLNPWGSGDFLVLYDPNNALYSNPESEAVSGAPGEGAVALDGLTLNLSRLLDTTKGDSPRLLQVVGSSLGSENMYVAKKEFLPTQLTMQPGGTSFLTGQFTDIPQTSLFALNYRRSLYTAYRGQYHPMARLRAPYLGLYAQPGASAYGNTEEFLDLLTCQNGSAAETADLDLGSVPAPLVPQGYEPVATAGDTYTVSYQLPGTSRSWSQKARVRSYSLDLPTAAQPMQPLVSPVKNPTINGLSLFGEQVGVGLTPTISWLAPDLGKPYGYVLQLYLLTADGDTTRGAMVARLFCDGDQTSLTVPAGLLVAGESYALNLRAFAGPKADMTSDPLRNAKYPYGCAETLSSIFKP